ncbi:hypothetical protein Vretifemale_16605 [Volvox reticuliferus]|uniref:Uncharacterized protein n=1 Tax=Volvox reticuliferus TaxID=1737510 RepID=A0A8J4FSN6_9CHLO|nr:hypothetical protein Vretifemale_16605 [Volvox reticuliferus]
MHRCILSTLVLSVVVVSPVLFSLAKVPTVSLHQSEVKDLNALSWSNGANPLESQLLMLGLAVQVAANGQLMNIGTIGAPDAYIIPIQHDQVLYSSAEYMDSVSSFVASGGLVILLDAGAGDGSSIRDFISYAFVARPWLHVHYIN